MSTQQPLTYQAFVGLASADPAVVGLILKGSQAHEGMVARYSGHDLRSDEPRAQIRVRLTLSRVGAKTTLPDESI